MIFTEALEKGQHLGTEFLTWLWWRAETTNIIQVADGSNVSVDLCGNVALQRISDTKDRVTVVGDSSQYREGIAALREGKVPTRARFLFSQGRYSFEVILDAQWLTVRSMKYVSSIDPKDGEQTPESVLLDRMAIIDMGWSIVDQLFRSFMDIRTHQPWTQVWREIKAWTQEAA